MCNVLQAPQICERASVCRSHFAPEHTATHYNPLQHTATYVQRLAGSLNLQKSPIFAQLILLPQHTGTHWNTLEHTSTHCNICATSYRLLQICPRFCFSLNFFSRLLNRISCAGSSKFLKLLLQKEPCFFSALFQKRDLKLRRCTYVAMCFSVLQCVAVCCQCVAVCCSVLQCVAVCCDMLQCVAVCCSVLQCVAVCCSVLQCVKGSVCKRNMKL